MCATRAITAKVPDIRILARPKPPDSLPVLEALTAPELRGLMNWIRFPFVEVEEGERTYTVRITDARYDRAIGQGFGSAIVQIPKTDQ